MAGQPLAPVIVVGSQKGGSGRTLLAVNLAAMWTLAGRRTLLVDLDPKGDATVSCGLPRATGSRTLRQLSDPLDFLRETLSVQRPPRMDVWPGGPALEQIQAGLRRQTPYPLDVLDRGLSKARQRYRAVVIDAPADLGPVSCNALAAADILLIPISGGALAAHALEQTIGKARELSETIRIYGVRLGVSDSELEALEPGVPVESPPGLVLLESVVCNDVESFRGAAAEGLPVFEYDPSSRAARCFLELGRELLARVIDAPLSA